MSLPFTATTETGIKIYRLSAYHMMNAQSEELMSYLNRMLLDKRLAGLEIEYHSQANIFYIHNVERPNYSFTVHCTSDNNRYVVAPRNISPNTYSWSIDSTKAYIESFFYVETEADLLQSAHLLKIKIENIGGINMYSHLSEKELSFSTLVMELFEKELTRKFGNSKKTFDYKDCVMFEIDAKGEYSVENHKVQERYIVLGLRYRADLGEFVFRGLLYNEVHDVLKRKRITVSEKTFGLVDDDYEIIFNWGCEEEIKIIIGAYIELIYNTLLV